MQCRQCGANARPGTKLCVYCGTAFDADAFDADAGGRGASPRGGQRRAGPQRRSGVDNERGDRSARDDSRRPYSAGRDAYSEVENDDGRSRGRGGEADGGSRNGYQRSSRADRDPLDDPRAPESVRSAPVRGGGGSARRGSSPANDRWRADERDGRSQNRRDDRSGAGRYDVDDRRSARDERPASDRNSNRGRGGRDPAYSDDLRAYSDEYPAPARQRDFVEAPGRLWQEDDDEDSRRAAFGGVGMEDSWGMPAATGWPDESGRMPATPGRGGRTRGGTRDGKRGGKRGRTKAEPSGKPIHRRMIVAGVLVCLLLVAGGSLLVPKVLSSLSGSSTNTCAGSASSGGTSPGAAPTLTSSQKQYTDKQSSYSIAYPSAWSSSTGTDTSQAQSDDLARFSQPSSSTFLTVEHTPSFDCATNTDIISAEVLGGQQAGETFTEIASDGGTQTVSGASCLRKEYAVTQGKTNLHVAIIACHHAGKGYAFVAGADANSYTQVSASDFQPMLSSFRFTG
ncbi:MAG: PsbP-related protein [Ktedonobacterales bacterium]